MARGLPGRPVDSRGRPAIDPTANVRADLKAAVRRLDDLRNADTAHLAAISRLRSYYEKRLTKAETKRVNAVNQVNQLNLQRALDVANAQAGVLATQVETGRQNTAQLLDTALAPINVAITEIRTWMLTQQGSAIADVRTRADSQWRTGTFISTGLAIAAIVALILVK